MFLRAGAPHMELPQSACNKNFLLAPLSGIVVFLGGAGFGSDAHLALLKHDLADKDVALRAAQEQKVAVEVQKVGSLSC